MCAAYIATISSSHLSTAQAVSENTSSIVSPQSWRKTARAARVAMFDKDYSAAIRAYQDAIASIRRAAPQSQAVYDLQLCLAEALRCDGRGAEAKSILDGVERDLNGLELSDPMLTCRYWRRRSRLQVDFKDYRAAGLSYLKALELYVGTIKPDEEDISTVLPQTIHDLYWLCYHLHDWELFNRLLQMQKTNYGANTEIFQGAAQTFDLMVRHSDELLAQKKLQEAERILEILTDCSYDKPVLYRHWIKCLEAGYGQNNPNELKRANAYIAKIAAPARDHRVSVDVQKAKIK